MKMKFKFDWMTEAEIYDEYSDYFSPPDVQRLAMDGAIKVRILDDGTYVYSRSDLMDLIRRSELDDEEANDA